MNKVSFYRTGDDSAALFTEALAQVPRVGDLVSYIFEPQDIPKWNPDILVQRERADKLVERWRVTEVHHLISCILVDKDATQVICVYIEPVS